MTFRSGCMLKRGTCASQTDRRRPSETVRQRIRYRSFVRYPLITLRQTNAEFSYTMNDWTMHNAYENSSQGE